MNFVRTKLMNVLLAASAAVVMGGCGVEESAPGESVSQTTSSLSGAQKVCRYASIRRDPNGKVFGFLAQGQTFSIYRHCGTHSDGTPCHWFYGYAFGHVNQTGWIEESALIGC